MTPAGKAERRAGSFPGQFRELWQLLLRPGRDDPDRRGATCLQPDPPDHREPDDALDQLIALTSAQDLDRNAGKEGEGGPYMV